MKYQVTFILETHAPDVDVLEAVQENLADLDRILGDGVGCPIRDLDSVEQSVCVEDLSA